MDGLLHVSEYGKGADTPLVCLHGFAGEGGSWLALQAAFEHRLRSLAFDLPGHGKSIAHEGLPYEGMADAVLHTLNARGEQRFHLIAHSMGAGVATTLAAMVPQRIASLTLVCPGGFGGEINVRLIRHFARETEAHELQTIIEQFFGPDAHVPRLAGSYLAGQRKTPAVTASLARIAEHLIEGTHQKPAPKAALADLDCPVRVLWGAQDKVLSPAALDDLPPNVAVHRFPHAGHMVHHEAARDLVRIMRLQLGLGDGH